MTDTTINKHIVLFDGECNFCNYWVNYIIKRDKKDAFRFSSLQSTIGKELLKQHKISSTIDSVLLIKQNIPYIKSTAALKIAQSLGGTTSILYPLIVIPRFIRDFFYDIIAKYRYKWFGKSNCEFIPTQKNKFLM
jgi:predicted DCC family thiol-disulfide oxidoreductase YuxK